MTDLAQTSERRRGTGLDLTRLGALSIACGVTEVVCYSDLNHIYVGIMTGNTVQLGWLGGTGQWDKALPILVAIFSFVIGCIVVTCLRAWFTNRRVIYATMAALLALASLVRLQLGLRLPLELPILAFTMALQSETLGEYAGVKLQTVVITNNLVKFCRAFTLRYLRPPPEPADRPRGIEVLVPAVCWCAFFAGAIIGGSVALQFNHPLLLPMTILLILALTSD